MSLPIGLEFTTTECGQNEIRIELPYIQAVFALIVLILAGAKGAVFALIVLILAGAKGADIESTLISNNLHELNSVTFQPTIRDSRGPWMITFTASKYNIECCWAKNLIMINNIIFAGVKIILFIDLLIDLKT